MNKIVKLAFRDYNAAVRTKGFIIGLALAPVFMCGSLIAMIFLQDHVDTADKTIAVIDRSGEVISHLIDETTRRNENDLIDSETGQKARPAYIIETILPDLVNPDRQKLALSDRVRSGDLEAFIEIGPGVVDPGEDRAGARLTYHSESSALSDVRRWIFWPINNRIKMLRVARTGLDVDKVDYITSRIDLEPLGLLSVDKSTGEVEDAKRSNEGEAIGIPMGMAMLFFMMMMMGAMPLLGTVLEEKMQRISEVLLGSISPFGLMMGKLLGGVGVSITAICVYVILGIITAQYLEVGEYVPYHVLPWFVIYMVMAIFMYGAINSAVGAACNDQKELQSLTFPAILPMIVPMFVMVPVLKEPTSTFATVLSLIPPFTPMLMVLRKASPTTIPAWQPWVGLLGVALFTLFAIWAGGRVFRVGLLMQGGPPKFRDLLRWAIRG